MILQYIWYIVNWVTRVWSTSVSCFTHSAKKSTIWLKYFAEEYYYLGMWCCVNHQNMWCCILDDGTLHIWDFAQLEVCLPALNKLGASMRSGYGGESGMWYCLFGQINSNTVEEPACSCLEDICRILPWWWTHAVPPKCVYQTVLWEMCVS